MLLVEETDLLHKEEMEDLVAEEQVWELSFILREVQDTNSVEEEEEMADLEMEELMVVEVEVDTETAVEVVMAGCMAVAGVERLEII